MKNTILNMALLAFVSFGAFSCKNTEKETESNNEEVAQATNMAVDYRVDTATSKIMWEGSKPTTAHHGTINLSSGNLAVKEGKIEAGKFAIDMNSINDEDLTGDDKAKLEAHLKGTAEGKEGDFFNTKKFATATFEMTGMENNNVKGNLTIKDKTNPVSFNATVSTEGDKIMLKSEPFIIDRTKWDVNYGSKSVFPNLGNKFISDDLKITVDLVADKV